MRSDVMKKGLKAAPHRCLFKAMGYTTEEINRPLIGIANSANQIVPGHIHLDKIAEAVAAGIRMAGGTPIDDNDWIEKWKFIRWDSSITTSYDKTARTITLDGSGTTLETAFLEIKSKTDLIKSTTYTLSVTVANVTKPCTIGVYGRHVILHEGWYEGFDEYYNNIAITTNGTKTLSFSTTRSGIDKIFLEIFNDKGLDLRIDDISLTRTSNEHFHTYNGVLESEQSAMTALIEMCNSFRVWPIWYNGVINFVINSDSTPVHSLSLGNTFNFSQSFTPLSEIPYILIGQFTDENDNYTMKQMAAKASSSKVFNKTNKQTIGLKGLTSIHKEELPLK